MSFMVVCPLLAKCLKYPLVSFICLNTHLPTVVFSTRHVNCHFLCSVGVPATGTEAYPLLSFKHFNGPHFINHLRVLFCKLGNFALCLLPLGPWSHVADFFIWVPYKVIEWVTSTNWCFTSVNVICLF